MYCIILLYKYNVYKLRTVQFWHKVNIVHMTCGSDSKLKIISNYKCFFLEKGDLTYCLFFIIQNKSNSNVYK